MRFNLAAPICTAAVLGAGLGIAACGGGLPEPAVTTNAVNVENGSASGSDIQTYDVDDRVMTLLPDLPPADINDVPIRIWVERARDGTLGAIRVTGHADAEVCAQASLDLMEFLADRKTVSGFLSFGVGELRPAAGATDYQAKATKLLAELTALEARYSDYVSIRFVDPSTPQLPSSRPGIATSARVAVLRFRGAAQGPAFVPVREWHGGTSAPVPLEIEMTPTMLGVSSSLMREIAPTIGAGPVAEVVTLIRDRLVRLERLESWFKSGGTLPNKGYRLSERPGPAPVAILDVYNRHLKEFELVRDAMRFLGELPEDQQLREDKQIRRAEQARLTNERCLTRLRSGLSCIHHVEVTESTSSKSESEELDADLADFAKLPPTRFADLRAQLGQRLSQTERRLGVLERSGTSQSNRDARETTVDGLLRGWPLPLAHDERMATRVNGAQEQALKSWGKTLSKLAAHGVDLRDAETPAGALARGNVFFVVREVRDGVYRVTPTYAVLGPYLEVWDATHHTVTVETRESVINIGALSEDGG